MKFPYFSFFWLWLQISQGDTHLLFQCWRLCNYSSTKENPALICNNHTTASAKGPQHLSNDLGTPSICITTDRDSLMQITLNRWGRSEDLRFHLLLFSQSFVNIKSSNKEDTICLCVLSVRGDLWRNFSACLRISWVYNTLQPCLCVPGN